MWLFRGAEAFERGHLGAVERADRRHARSNGASAHNHRARAALSEAAPEFRSVQREVVAQHVEQRCRGIDVDRVSLAINGQSN